MSIIRINKPRGEFAVLPKQAINDANLSWEARGMLAYLLDKPDSWQVRFVDLIRQSPAGRDQTRRILHELEDAGYIMRQQVRNEDGTYDWRSEVHETPQVVETAPPVHKLPVEPSTGNQYMEPSTGNPSTVEPSTVNQYIYQEPSEQELSEQELSDSSGSAPTLGDLWRLFSERFSEVFGYMPPYTMTGDDGTFEAMVKRGLTLAHVDAGISTSLDTFKPTSLNRYPKSWRYCLPAIERALAPPPKPARNGRQSANDYQAKMALLGL